VTINFHFSDEYPSPDYSIFAKSNAIKLEIFMNFWGSRLASFSGCSKVFFLSFFRPHVSLNYGKLYAWIITADLGLNGIKSNESNCECNSAIKNWWTQMVEFNLMPLCDSSVSGLWDNPHEFWRTMATKFLHLIRWNNIFITLFNPLHRPET
jgi:hypothetical protein